MARLNGILDTGIATLAMFAAAVAMIPTWLAIKFACIGDHTVEPTFASCFGLAADDIANFPIFMVASYGCLGIAVLLGGRAERNLRKVMGY